jgi:hypothetical protein
LTESIIEAEGVITVRSYGLEPRAGGPVLPLPVGRLTPDEDVIELLATLSGAGTRDEEPS